MNYLFTPRIYGKLVLLLIVAGSWNCKGKGPRVAQASDTAGYAEGNDSTHGTRKDVMKPVTTTLPDGTRVLMDPRTVIRPSEGFGKTNRDIQLDGEAMLIVRSDAGKPFVIHTCNLVIHVLGTRLHIDAFASSPGEQVDLLEGKLRVTKSYHSSTDNEPETLHAGEMVMINRDIDLMEKETLSPEEQKSLEVKFPLSDTTAPRN
ncbi:MAG TPA: FecR domain-containing protein [Puia sp.]|nr:FecR domain-containing protein [Puia sp.]